MNSSDIIQQEIYFCKNCNYPTEGKFCSNCGQSTSTKDINHKYVWGEISDSIFKVNNNFLLTAKELFVRPSQMIKNYMNGKRIRYFRPISYVLILVALYTSIEHGVNKKTFLEQMLIEFKNVYFKNVSTESTQVGIFNWLISNAGITFLMLIPIVSISSYVAFYSFKNQNNYFKHLLLNTYINGQTILVYIIFSVFTTFLNDEFSSYLNFIRDSLIFIYSLNTLYHFFNEFKPITRLFRIALFYIIVSVFVVVFGLFILLINQ